MFLFCLFAGGGGRGGEGGRGGRVYASPISDLGEFPKEGHFLHVLSIRKRTKLEGLGCGKGAERYPRLCVMCAHWFICASPDKSGFCSIGSGACHVSVHHRDYTPLGFAYGLTPFGCLATNCSTVGAQIAEMVQKKSCSTAPPHRDRHETNTY